MFRQIIRDTQFTSDAANSFFQNITGNSFNGDASFVSTLRALVAPRMAKDEQIHLNFYSSSYSSQQLECMPTTEAVRYVSNVSDCDEGKINIHNFCNPSQENNFAWLELMKSTFSNVYDGWHYFEKLTLFYKKSFYAVCFINPDKKNVVIFVDNLNIQKMHYLQCSIIAFLPWYFNPEQGVSQLEMSLVESLRMKNSVQYKNIVAEIADKYDFREVKIRNLLAGFETKYERIKCEEIKNEINQYRYNIDDLNSQIGQNLNHMRDCEIMLLGLETKIANESEESEIMDYFMCNNNLILEQVTNDIMVFVTKGYLEYFDEDMAETVICNRDSCIYKPNGRACNNLIEADNIEKLMRAIFISQTLRIKTCAAYRFELNGRVSSVSHYPYPAECRDCTPNPHIDAYSCMGNYSRTINELLKNRNYIGAIEQCMASCRSLNFGDSTVLAEFVKRLYGISNRETNVRCIELPDGSIVTPIEAVTWLNEREAANNE